MYTNSDNVQRRIQRSGVTITTTTNTEALKFSSVPS
jgi:hypothetical protein